MGLPSQYKKSYLVQRQNLFIICPYASVYNSGNATRMLLVLAPEFVALCTVNFWSHSCVRAELEI